MRKLMHPRRLSRGARSSDLPRAVRQRRRDQRERRRHRRPRATPAPRTGLVQRPVDLRDRATNGVVTYRTTTASHQPTSPTRSRSRGGSGHLHREDHVQHDGYAERRMTRSPGRSRQRRRRRAGTGDYFTFNSAMLSGSDHPWHGPHAVPDHGPGNVQIHFDELVQPPPQQRLPAYTAGGASRFRSLAPASRSRPASARTHSSGRLGECRERDVRLPPGEQLEDGDDAREDPPTM